MREIKFRAWDKGVSRMVDVGLIANGTPAETETGVHMQFTGLKDKNGKEIFEGDYVKGWIPDSERDEELEIGEVAFYEGGFDIYWGSHYLGSLASCVLNKSIEVIGNKYEGKGR